jgi:hypothetical protein
LALRKELPTVSTPIKYPAFKRFTPRKSPEPIGFMFQELLLSLGKRSEGLILAWPEQLGGRPIELEADAETELS